MKERQTKRREKVNVWLAIDITLVVAALRMYPPVMRAVVELDRTLVHVPVVNWTMNFLFFWLLGLLWLAYREWRLSPSAGPA